MFCSVTTVCYFPSSVLIHESKFSLIILDFNSSDHSSKMETACLIHLIASMFINIFSKCLPLELQERYSDPYLIRNF